jgi:hypothetical protein
MTPRIFAMLLCLVTPWAACQKADAAHSSRLGYGLSQRELSLGVCEKLCQEQEFPEYNAVSVWMSGNYDPRYWEPLFKNEQKGIDKVRKWALSLPECPLRTEYLRWLDYYQNDDIGGLKGARDEVYFHTIQRERGLYDAGLSKSHKSIKKSDLASPGSKP